MVARRCLASFSCQIHTTETPQGCFSSIRDGFQLFLQLKVGFMSWTFLVMKADSLIVYFSLISYYALLCCLLNLIVTYMIVLGCCALGGGSGSFILKSNSNSGSGSSGRIRTAKYSIALQYLILEGITEDSER